MNHTHRNEFILSTTSLGLHSSNWCTIYVDSYKSLSRFQVWSRRYIDFYFLLLVLIKKSINVSREPRRKFFSLSLFFPLLKFFAIFGQSRRRNGTRWNDRNRSKKERKKDKKKRNGTISSGEDRVSIHHIHLHF